jgi:hypothetical protein
MTGMEEDKELSKLDQTTMAKALRKKVLKERRIARRDASRLLQAFSGLTIDHDNDSPVATPGGVRKENTVSTSVVLSSLPILYDYIKLYVFGHSQIQYRQTSCLRCDVAARPGTDEYEG